MVTIGGIPNPWRAGRNSSAARLDFINRSGNGENVLKRALAKVKPEDGGDAHFRFGKASRFTLTEPAQKTNPGTTVTWPPEEPIEDPEDGIVVIDYDYIDRAVETIRIENPDDSEQWVEVERITKIMFRRRDDGVYIRLNFDWSKEPSGG
ncbi:MAG: hypothetical protein EOR30_17085 [Mesorhizobium sp.]|uniref:hypothetical protein n=1 Tax=unclassified Mesorhizobium TaxID=325217 RepID=UPI000FCAAFF8|nr:MULTISPECIES: hypothetical protein [unclassified Mesorhizobium]RUV75918.1 hypothetical protein EOA78_04770 [Mesorhizobium sp. M5C.F.Cr.IN.023.01.1.1]RWB26890.1 MAG: hypothetical protein EOQ43_29025 [Mesorhizobium sp.]RWB36605.1 MAG: hypothetical protein EOQ42_31555 [Mesorhizobium sp.]RWF85795.1 MAG: hypothetical protein EOQ36_21040 [Mesorhizobium sp.]RWF95293.1 MAG: hypothetical protein EOQ45_08150 [Mesorhizobium sp.]